MIYETIVTTRNMDGSIHPAPMGVHEESNVLSLQPFVPCTSLDNLLRDQQAVINCCDDVRLFAGCVTGRRDWHYYPSTTVKGGVITHALSHYEVRIIDSKEDPIRPIFYCQIVDQQQHSAFKGFNRAQSAVIEASILISRIHLLPLEEVESELNYLRKAVEKTAGEREQQAWRWLMERFNTFSIRYGKA